MQVKKIEKFTPLFLSFTNRTFELALAFSDKNAKGTAIVTIDVSKTEMLGFANSKVEKIVPEASIKIENAEFNSEHFNVDMLRAMTELQHGISGRLITEIGRLSPPMLLDIIENKRINQNNIMDFIVDEEWWVFSLGYIPSPKNKAD